MDLVLNNQQWLICHKTKLNKKQKKIIEEEEEKEEENIFYTKCK